MRREHRLASALIVFHVLIGCSKPTVKAIEYDDATLDAHLRQERRVLGSELKALEDKAVSWGLLSEGVRLDPSSSDGWTVTIHYDEMIRRSNAATLWFTATATNGKGTKTALCGVTVGGHSDKPAEVADRGMRAALNDCGAKIARAMKGGRPPKTAIVSSTWDGELSDDKGAKYPFTLVISVPSAGRMRGTMTWRDPATVAEVEGTFEGDRLVFVDTRVLSGAPMTVGDVKNVVIDGKTLKGTDRSGAFKLSADRRD